MEIHNMKREIKQLVLTSSIVLILLIIQIDLLFYYFII